MDVACLAAPEFLGFVLHAGRFGSDEAHIDFELLEGLIGQDFFRGLLALDIDDAFARQIGGDADLGAVEADLVLNALARSGRSRW